jgi:uncharacterized protein
VETFHNAQKDRGGTLFSDHRKNAGTIIVRAFVDTSSLFKKYVEENGADEFNRLLDSVFDIIVSPVTIIELHSILERRLREKTIVLADAQWVEKEFQADYQYFGVVEWNETLLQESIRVVRRHQLRVLDGIQLASGLLAGPSLFITSDRKLYDAALKELPSVNLI